MTERAPASRDAGDSGSGAGWGPGCAVSVAHAARGGSLESLAGGAAVVVDPDPLSRLHAEAAARLLGFVVPEGLPASEWGGCPSVVFLSMDAINDCPRLSQLGAAGGFSRGRRLWADAAAGGGLLVGYVAGPEAVLAAHRVHGCCAIVLRLGARGGRARFAYPPAGHALGGRGSRFVRPTCSF